jgi:hypothetical protein
MRENFYLVVSWKKMCLFFCNKFKTLLNFKKLKIKMKREREKNTVAQVMSM